MNELAPSPNSLSTRLDLLIAQRRDAWALWDKADQAIDEKLLSIIRTDTIATSVLGLATAAAWTDATHPAIGLLLAGAILCLAIMLVIAAWAWRPLTYSVPGLRPEERAEIAKQYLDVHDDACRLAILGDYLKSTVTVRDRTVAKGRWAAVCIVLLALQVGLVAAAVLVRAVR